jgi:hypothetical protein
LIDRLDALLDLEEVVEAEKRASSEERQMALMWIVCLTEPSMQLRCSFLGMEKKSAYENEGEDAGGGKRMDIDVDGKAEMNTINRELDEWDQELDKTDDGSGERKVAVTSEETDVDESPSWAMWEGPWVPRPIGVVEASNF